MKPSLVLCALFSVGCLAAPQGTPGEPGIQGPRGSAGPKGDQGEPGIPEAVYRPLLSALCNAAIDLLAADGTSGRDGIRETFLSYNWTLYINGDVDVDCETTFGSQSGGGSAFFPSVTMGASLAGCGASVDYPPQDNVGGFWDFESQKNVGFIAIYKDGTSHPLNGMTYTFQDADCNIRKLDDDLAWTTISLPTLLAMANK